MRFLAAWELLSCQVECVITVNNEESPEDMADLIEYCFALQGPWARLRASDGRLEPYRSFTLELGNEQPLAELIAQVRRLASAMGRRARELRLTLPRIVVGQNLQEPLGPLTRRMRLGAAA